MKQKLWVIAIAILGMMSLVACGDKVVAPTQVPPEIQSFVQQNFPNKAITYAEKEWELFGSKYDVVLADGTQIKFDTDNVWVKVKSPTDPVHAALVPAPIAAYVNTNFPSVAIVKLDKEHNGCEVELANGLELKFNKQGVS